jgi:hypothetical protein
MKAYNKIHTATFKLLNYIERENYSGCDPYDALKSPLFKLPFFRKNKWIRFGTQQLVKRSPINLRPLLRILPGCNPVTLGLCIQAYSNLIKVFPEKKSTYEKNINLLLKDLVSLIPEGYKGASWGYDFDWEARYLKIPAYEPTIVATGFITNALFNSYLTLNLQEALDLCVSSTNFILHDINRTHEGDNFCFSYSPFDKQVIFNASMKGVRVLAQVYSITKDESLKEQAQKAVAYVIKHQNKNGAWIYSKNNAGGRIDNYHTGYIIDCLDEYIKHTGDEKYLPSLQNGFSFYRENFFRDNKIPKFYDHNTYPVDCTAAAQSLLTLTRFNEIALAQNIASWMIDNMQDSDGYFYFRKSRNKTIKTPFMRWSNAWMFLGLTEMMRALNT